MKNIKTISHTGSALLPVLAALSTSAFAAQLNQNVSINHETLTQPHGSVQQINQGGSAMDAMEADAFTNGNGGGHHKTVNRVILSAADAASERIPSAVLAIHSRIGT